MTEKQHGQNEPPVIGHSSPEAVALPELTPCGYCRLDARNCIREASPVFDALLKRHPGAADGISFLSYVAPEDTDSVTHTIESVRSGAENTAFLAVELLLADEERLWIAGVLNLSPDEQNSTSAGSRAVSVTLHLQAIDELTSRMRDLQKSERRWKHALKSAHQGVWDHNFRSGEFFYSPTWKALRGLDVDTEVDGALETWIKTVHPDDREHVLKHIKLQDEGTVDFNTFQYRERHADGHWVWIESRGAAIAWDADGKPVHVIGTDADISERRRAETALEEVSRRLRLALDVSKIGVFEADLDHGTVIRDEQLLRIYDFNPEVDDPALIFEHRLHPEDRDQAMKTVADGTKSGVGFFNDFRIIQPDGSIRHIRSRSMTFTDAEGTRKLIGANWDVTDDVALHEELHRQKRLTEARNIELEAARVAIEFNALHDHLTGLPNRRYLDQALEAWGRNEKSYTAVLHIDLDRFKQINDTLGHQAGDAMLVHTAETLRTLSGPDDFVARIGGDEFVILCHASRSEGDVVGMADGIISALRQPVPYQGHSCRFGASVGIAWAGPEIENAKQSLMNADIALYRAKGLGRNRFEFFTHQMQTQVHHAKRTADEILKGLEDGEFIPMYQPQFDAQTRAICGVETLARWMHPQLGLLSPDYFLRIAEDIGAVSVIDRAIAERATRDFQRWSRLGLGIERYSVNVSSRRLREPDLVDSVKRMDIPPGVLSFELLESIFLDDIDEEIDQTIRDLKALGIDIEIDDFGTGHASIIGLLKLSPSRLKIDRALVKPLVANPEQRRLVGSIIDIGHSLKIEVVAEGVETLQHADILAGLGCNILQGYALAKPMQAQEIEAFAGARLQKRRNIGA